MSNTPTPIADYRVAPFSASTASGTRISHDIYRRGSGAPVVLIQELPGIGPETLHLADEFVARGFEIVLPHLFGPLGKVSTAESSVGWRKHHARLTNVSSSARNTTTSSSRGSRWKSW